MWEKHFCHFSWQTLFFVVFFLKEKRKKEKKCLKITSGFCLALVTPVKQPHMTILRVREDSLDQIEVTWCSCRCNPTLQVWFLI